MANVENIIAEAKEKQRVSKLTTNEELYFSTYQSSVLKAAHKIHPVNSHARSRVPKLISTITNICADGWKYQASIQLTCDKVCEYIKSTKS